MSTSNIFKLYLFCFIIIFSAGCTPDEAQNDFESQALTAPSGIVAMDADGTPTKNGENDNNDWQIAPQFTGLISVETPAFPNPISYNSSFEILINVKTINAINGLYVYAFQQPSALTTAAPLETQTQTLDPGLQSIHISPQEFAQSSNTGTIGNTYRIIFYDGQNNIITYGDVLVE